MDKNEIKTLLAETVSQLFVAPSGRKLNTAVNKRLKLYTVEKTVSLSDYSYSSAASALSQYGIIIESDDNMHIGGLLMSGYMNMNPAYVEITYCADSIHIQAHALEGLIKQNTAAKAIDILESHINR